jgi:hypothetical protein
MARSKTLLGVVHLLPLPSACGHRSMDRVLEAAIADARAIAAGGLDGIVIENFGDAPFHRGDASDPVPPDVPAALAMVAYEIRRECELPVAVNCLRNDGMAALGAAAAAGADWIRVNVLTSAYVTDQGLIQGEAARLAAYRKQLGWRGKLLADFLVKHAAPLAPLDLATGARDLAERSGADGMVLSGNRTGDAVDVEFFDGVRAAVGGFPIWIGSGLCEANAAVLWPRCDGAIVGTSIKRGGKVQAPVDPLRVKRLRAACRSAERR